MNGIGFGTNVFYRESKDSENLKAMPKKVRKNLGEYRAKSFDRVRDMLEVNGLDNETFVMYPTDPKSSMWDAQYSKNSQKPYMISLIGGANKEDKQDPFFIEKKLLDSYYFARSARRYIR